MERAEPRADPEQAAGASEMWHQVERALHDLKPELRAVVVLRHFQGLSYREMADVLWLPENKVKSRLFSARQRLRAMLLERGFAG